MFWDGASQERMAELLTEAYMVEQHEGCVIGELRTLVTGEERVDGEAGG